jgi:hypothetical protein
MILPEYTAKAERGETVVFYLLIYTFVNLNDSFNHYFIVRHSKVACSKVTTEEPIKKLFVLLATNVTSC